MLRPASRRSDQQGASPHGDNPSPYQSDPYQHDPYQHDPYGPDDAPYGPDPSQDRSGPSPYGPDAAPYGRGPSPYDQDRSPYEPDPYGANSYGPNSYGPNSYGPNSYGPNSYGPGTHESYRPGTHEPNPAPYHQAASPYGPGPAGHGSGLYPPGPGRYGQAWPNDPQPYDSDETPPPDDGDGGYDGRPPGHRRRGRRDGDAKGPGWMRRLLRRRTVRVILVLIAVFCCWLAFSIGQALTAPGGGSMSSKLAEWARDHYLGPVVTFGEWLSYQPPKVGGKPSSTIAVPSGAAVKYKKVHGFRPDIPAKLHTFAGSPLAGEGQWRVLETVKGEPAIFGTFLRPSAVYTSYVAGIVSMDQRLVTFQLRPGAEDPGSGNWKAHDWIPPGTRTGLLATFNGGFKISTSGGGFYLNGDTAGTLTDGAASVVYYRNGTVKVGQWGRDVRMTQGVVGVRQNLRLIVDHGHVPASVNQDVLGSWGATLGGGYYVWRSGLGITKDGRIIFVYGPALNVQELADLLQRAGAVEALQLDINPFWMSYEYYKADGHASDPTPVNLLISQQQSAYRYYSVYSRDFTAVYAR